MSHSSSYENLLKSILKIQSNLYLEPTDNPTYREDSYAYKHINEFSKNENAVKVIFNKKNLNIIYISDNIEALSGYSSKDFYVGQMRFALEKVTLEHVNSIHNWLDWSIGVQSKLGDSPNTKQTVCGIKIKHKNGRIMSLMFRYSALEITENSTANVAAVSIDDVSHLIKSDFYWGRLEQEKGETINIHHFSSMDKKDNPNDIITDREKAVLHLLAEGKESKEIGEMLYISHHTVDNHRRSMIAKIGVKDTTGLIQICRMAGII